MLVGHLVTLRSFQDRNDEIGHFAVAIETPRIAQETNTLVVVGTNARQDDKVLFTALESIDGGNLNFLVVLFLEATRCLHRTDNVTALTFIWGNDTDIARLYTSLEEASDDLLDVLGLGTVEVGCTGR